MEAHDTVDAASERIDAAGAVSDPSRYNLRPRGGREGVAEEDTRPGLNVTDGLGRRTGATVLISGVDAKTSPLQHESANRAERGRSPDRREPAAVNRERRASSRSSDAGSEFSSAPGSPVSVREAKRSPPTRRARGEEIGALGRPHRHRSPPLFEDMNWADLEAYRKLHIAFQKQRLREQQLTSRVHELAIRPDSPSLVDEEKEVNPLRARNKSTVFETTASQQPGRDGKHASRVSRRFLDNKLIRLSYV